MTDKQKLRFQELQSMNLKVGRAWAIKEMFAEFWNYSYKGSARKFFRRWFAWASRSKLKPVIGLVKFSARGFRNPESFRTAILFYCGRLNLYP